MIITINEKKEVTNLHIFIDKIQNDKEEADIDVSNVGNLLEAHNENHKFFNKHGVYKYYLNDQNELQIRSETEILILEKQFKHKQLNELTRSKILAEYPLEEQISSSLDIYGNEHKNTMKQRIKDIIDASNVIQATIYSKQKMSTLDAVDINFEV